MNALEELEAALIQSAPYVVALEDGDDHRSLQIEARLKGHANPLRVLVCDREGVWWAHDGSWTVRAHGWLWEERPGDVDAITSFHQLRDDYGELSLPVTAEDICAQLAHLLTAMVEIVALSRRLRPRGGATQPDTP